MILDNDLRKEELYKGLAGVDINSNETPPILVDYMDYVSRTGLPLFDWQFLRPIIVMKLEKEARSLFRDSHDSHEIEFESMLQMCKDRLNSFRGTPFTFQRLCELLADVRSYYHRPDKFLRGFSKLVMVVSTIDPEGNKLVDFDDRVLSGKEPSVPSSPSGSVRSNLNGSTMSPISPHENGFTNSGRKLWSNNIQATFSPPSSPPTSVMNNGSNGSSLLGVRSPHPNSQNLNPTRINTVNTQHVTNFYTGSPIIKRNSSGVPLRSPLTAFLEREDDDSDAKPNEFQADSASKGQKDGATASGASSSAFASQGGFIQQDSIEFSASSNLVSHNFDSKELRPIGRLEEIVEKMPSLVGGGLPLDGHGYHLSPLKQDVRLDMSALLDSKKSPTTMDAQSPSVTKEETTECSSSIETEPQLGVPNEEGSGIDETSQEISAHSDNMDVSECNMSVSSSLASLNPNSSDMEILDVSTFSSESNTSYNDEGEDNVPAKRSRLDNLPMNNAVASERTDAKVTTDAESATAQQTTGTLSATIV